MGCKKSEVRILSSRPDTTKPHPCGGVFVVYEFWAQDLNLRIRRFDYQRKRDGSIAVSQRLMSASATKSILSSRPDTTKPHPCGGVFVVYEFWAQDLNLLYNKKQVLDMLQNLFFFNLLPVIRGVRQLLPQPLSRAGSYRYSHRIRLHRFACLVCGKHRQLPASVQRRSCYTR